MALRARVVHSLLHFATAYCAEESAIFVHYGEEKLPALFCDSHGEMFHIVAAACGVYHLIHVALFLKQELLVAGNALRESVGLLVRHIERSNHNRVHTGHTSRESLGLAAKQVHMCVVYSLVEARCCGAHQHLGGTVALGLVLLYNQSPQHAGGAELGDFHEEVRRHAHVELDAASHLNGTAAGFGEQVEPRSTPCESIAKLLIYISTAVCKDFAVYCEATQTLHVGNNVEQSAGLSLHGIGIEALDTMHKLTAQGVIIYRAAESVGGAGSLNHGNKSLGYGESLAGAAFQVDFHFCKVDAGKKLRKLGRVAHLEAK